MFEVAPQHLEGPCTSQGGYLLVQLLTLEIDLHPAEEQSLSGFLVLAYTSSVGERWSFQVVFKHRLSKDVFITVVQERNLERDLRPN